ncbi:MAG: Csp1 family four helix bundle copper storage protein [Burkholderiales bacterium]
MERRDAIVGMGAIAGAVFVKAAMAADSEHHHVSGKYADLIASAAECVQTGQACINHCFMLLGDGKKEMAACARSVNQLISVCNTLEALAAGESKLLGQYAKVAMEFCQECEKECRKHEKHELCKACAEACAECAKECKAVSA